MDLDKLRLTQIVSAEFLIVKKLQASGLIKPAFVRCGEGENICNCKSPEDCGYIEIFKGINEYDVY